MKKPTDTTIAMVERCYDLDIAEAHWLRAVMAAGLPVLDHGLGVAGLIGVKPPTPGPIEIVDMKIASGPLDFAERHMAAMSALPPELLYRETRHARVATLSECPDLLEVWARHVDHAKDALGVTALDPDGHGLHIMAALPVVTKLSPGERKHFRMLAAHLAAGHRLRRALRNRNAERRATAPDALPRGAEAVIDPVRFKVTEALGEALKADHSKVLRERAMAVDQARGQLCKEEPARALEIWRGLVRGRWSIVDWFDSDDRRYVLAIPNPPRILDPRGLSEREAQVLAYARLGESHGSIAYHLGISRSTVTKALNSAMRKLGVSTRPELLARLNGLPLSAPRDDEPTP